MAAEHQTTITDNYGNTMKAITFDVGSETVNYAAAFRNIQNIFPKLNQFQSRSTDVWICAYPKSGTHWMNEMLCQLLNGHPSEFLKSTSMLDFRQSIGELDGVASPRLLNTHIPFKYLPQQIKASKIVYIIRNPLSVALSYYYHAKNAGYGYTGSAEQFIESYAVTLYSFLGSWFEHVKDAYKTSQLGSNVLLCYYEEMLENPVKTIRELSHFLECETTEESLMKIGKQTSLVRMKEHFSNTEGYVVGGGINAGAMIRNGEAAEWRQHVSQEFLTNFMQTYNRELKDYPELLTRIKI